MFFTKMLTKTNIYAVCALAATFAVTAAGNAGAASSATPSRYQQVSQAFGGFRPDYRIVMPYGPNVFRATPPGQVSEPFDKGPFGPRRLHRISPTERYPAPIQDRGLVHK